MDNKRKFSSLPPSSLSEADPRTRELLLPSRKVCIVCGTLSINLDCDWVIFIVDLIDSEYGDEVFIPGDPTLRLSRDAFGIRAFCVLNSMLYMFDGYDKHLNPHGGRSVFTYDLSTVDDNTFNLNLEKDMLVEKRKMLHPKQSPVAAPTPDGKLLVFSAQIEIPADYLDADEKFDFELYDPTNDSWRQLPAICPPLRKSTSFIAFGVKTYGFISKSVLFLQTEIGMFSLDLESPESEGWLYRDSWAGAPKIPIYGGPFSVIGDGELCLTPWGIYDVTKENGFSQCLYNIRSSFGNYDVLSISRMITLLGDGDHGQCNFCILETGINEGANYPHLIVDVYCCDSTKYKEDKKKIGGAAHLSTCFIKSIKFLVGARCPMFYPVSFFSIRAGSC